VLLLASILLTPPSGASVVWSDNFDDGNLDGWTVSGTSYYPQLTPATGNYTLVNKTLQGYPLIGSGVWHYTLVSHPLLIDSGTYSLDISDEGNTPNFLMDLELADTNSYSDPNYPNRRGYDFTMIFTGRYIISVEGPEIPNKGEVLKDGNLPYRPTGWTHIDVTRTANGLWSFYVNGAPVFNFTDDSYKPKYFSLLLRSGMTYDNVVVSDTIYVPPGSLRLTVKDSSGNALSGAAVSSTKQPSGQTALSGTTVADGSVTFTGLAVGNYTLQVSKSGYLSGTAQGAVASGAKTEASTTLQAQPSSGGIPGFPIASVVVGVLLFTALFWLYNRRLRIGGVLGSVSA